MELPRHVAIIMDGNGRWARKRLLPRVAGHQQGLESVRAIITACVKKEIACLTLFTFSSENWRRSENEVSFIFGVFLRSLHNETKTLHENNIRLKIIGDRSAFSEELKAAILTSEQTTEKNTGLQLNIAFNYGGRWDIVEASRKLAKQVAAGKLLPEDISLKNFAEHLALSDCPEPDLLIRTSGEYRISNFLLWQLAYTELYFTDAYFPDFREAQFEEALKAYAKRQRRFGASEAQSHEDLPLNFVQHKEHA
ncbi:MAG TPA: polyprenyl diphosphate synthase [Gammaproteobacteria bacterium]|nr:polyprenyl diphosphate synthase [Gammaproteobacteria bacterium]